MKPTIIVFFCPEDGPDLDYVALGWGRTNNIRRDRGDTAEGGAHSNILQKLALPFIPIQECKETKDRGGQKPYATLTDDKQVCAGGRFGKLYRAMLFRGSKKSDVITSK